MDTNLILPEEAVMVTKCSLCNNYLSVPPIFTISQDGTQHKCGRCREVECVTYVRIFCYENIAKFLTFPCTYRHCKEKIPWAQVAAHERTCRYKTLACPLFYQGCGEIVEAGELWVHFTQNHIRNVRYDNIITSLKVNELVVYLLVVRNQHFVVYMCINDRELSYVSVFSIVPVGNITSYNVELSSVVSGISIKYGHQKVVPYDERRHCLKCNEQECSRKYHPYSMVYNKPGESKDVATTKLNLNAILDFLERPDSLTFSISVDSDEALVHRKRSSSVAGDVQ